jgi:hypothetical protein
MKTSTELNEIAAALVGFHKAMGKVKKEANNPFFKSKYASLPNILDAIREPLILNNLSVVQFPTGENELTTILMHASGQFMQSSYLMRPVKNDPQGVGSCITYQRRYAVGAILSLSIDEDDDGNAASQPAKTQVNGVKKPVLSPEDKEKWKGAITFLMTNNGTLAQIKSKYEISAENVNKLVDAAAQTV